MVGVKKGAGKPPCKRPSSVHSGCKSDYIDERYQQYDLKNKHAGTNLDRVARPPSSVHDTCRSDYVSERSNAGRSRYSVLSKTSDVEDELFGHESWYSKAQTHRKKKEKEDKKPAMVSKTTPPKEAETDIVIINTGDIDRIKKKAVILTPKLIEERKKRKEADREKRMAIANQRKALMLKLEADRKKKSGPMSDSEVLKKQNDAMILEEAVKTFEERMDDVKEMNQICTYSKCVTLRDGQKMDKINRYNTEKEEDMKIFCMMEQGRKRLIEFYDKQEQKKLQERLAGAAVIRQQIKFNEVQRQIADEAKLQEGLKIKREAQRNLEEDLKKAEAKKLAGIQMMKFMEQENAKAEKEKEKAKIVEMIEEEKRNMYNHEKDMREQAYHAELERIRKEKELETARLRALQEKAADKMGALEELRAQRIQEAHEREWREKEHAEAEKIRRMNEQLLVAREQQKIMKARQLADQVIGEQMEFYKILKLQKESLAKAKLIEEEHHKANMKHREEIMAQIRKKEEARKKELAEKFAEGERLKQALRVEKLRLEQIKERKLKELEKWGVPPKYRVDLVKLKVGLP